MHDSTLPRHARTGLTAIGWRKPRRGEDGPQPIWPILGGAPDDEDDEGTGDDEGEDGADSDDEGDDSDPDGADELGDAGKRALDAMKTKWRTERERRKAAETERDQLKAKPSEGGDDADSIRAAARTEARAEALRERALDRLEAKAARVLADPEDARAYLGARVEDFIDGDAIDNEAIADALGDLLKRKPYLAATAGTKPRFEGTGDGGARKAPTGPKQLTAEDVKKLTPEQIDEAHRKGQLRDYLGS